MGAIYAGGVHSDPSAGDHQQAAWRGGGGDGGVQAQTARWWQVRSEPQVMCNSTVEQNSVQLYCKTEQCITLL